MKEKIVIFGAGEFGRQAYEILGDCKTTAFADNDPQRKGQDFCGKIIISPEDVLNEYKGSKVVIANAKYSKEIYEQLHSIGIENCIFYRQEYLDIFKGLKNEKSDGKLILGDEEIRLLEDIAVFIEGTQSRIEILSLEEYNNKTDKSINDNIYIYSKLQHASIRNKMEGYSNVHDILFSNLWSDKQMVRTPSLEEWEHGLDEDNWSRQLANNGMVQMTAEYMKSIREIKKTPLFKIIEIETINRCNSKCGFCPCNVFATQNERCYMEDELFYKIVDQLIEIDYDGQIELYSANEPLLDPKIVDRYSYVRKNLKKAKVTILSNGLLLNLDLYLKIIDNVDEFIINNYSTERQLHDNLKEIVEYCEKNNKDSYIDKTKIFIRRIDEVLSSRGGTAPNKVDADDYGREGCALPFLELIIGSNGKIKMCSQDPFCKHPVGDVNHEKLLDIWYGEKLENVRKNILQGRIKEDLCRNCDYFYIQ